MSFTRPRRLGLAVACALALANAGCVVTPLVTGDGTFAGGGLGGQRNNGLNPVIQMLDANPKATADKDAKITFTVVASSPANLPLQYNWSATKGVLSATTGQVVYWSPTKADGSLDTAGDAQISVIITTSNGGAVTGTALVKILPDGSTKVVSAGPAEPKPSASPSAKPSDKPSDTPSASPKPGASDEPKPDTPATGPATPAECKAEKVTPSLAAPGTVVVVHGKGFTGEAKVTAGDRALEIVQVNEQAITARIPKDMPIKNDQLPVAVTVCGQTYKVEGTVTVANTADFGGDVTQAGAGLLANVYQLDAGTEKLPADLDSRKPHSSLLVTHLDVPTRSFTAGFPGVSADLKEWFAIAFTGNLTTAKAGTYKFGLNSDDGSKLWIDGKLVVDNDGQHPTEQKDGDIELTAGSHKVRVDYFQGPATEIALQLYWTAPGGTTAEIVPASAFGQATAATAAQGTI